MRGRREPAAGATAKRSAAVRLRMQAVPPIGAAVRTYTKVSRPYSVASNVPTMGDGAREHERDGGNIATTGAGG